MGRLLSNYRESNNSNTSSAVGKSEPCGHCSLCGHYQNAQSMVQVCSTIATSNGNAHLNQDLNCSSYGIYVAICNLCKAQYVGQTKNSFSTRWRGHRATWNKFEYSQRNDKAALLRHYASKHGAALRNKPEIAECFSVVFVEQPPMEKLDLCEAKWMQRTKATINIQRKVLPRVR